MCDIMSDVTDAMWHDWLPRYNIRLIMLQIYATFLLYCSIYLYEDGFKFKYFASQSVLCGNACSFMIGCSHSASPFIIIIS